MKKLVVFIMFLGLASTAHAVLYTGGLDFTLNGETQPAEIWLEPSQSVKLGLELLDGHDILGYTLDYVLSNETAELLAGGIEFPTVFSFPGSAVVGGAQNVTITAAQFLVPAVEGPSVLMTELYIHCLGPGDVLLEIIAQAGTTINGEAIDPGTVIHALTIHQVPEPATTALLGLGGLLLRRKKT